MTIRPQPCAFCPYRRDVPSGVWHEEEYRKLMTYDAPTHSQPHGIFMCHEKSGCMCSGWAQVHENRPGCELIALRLAQITHGVIELPAATVPLFASGTEAAKHGMRDIIKPSAAAIRAQEYITALQVRCAIYMWDNGGLSICIPKKRSKGYLIQPYGHHHIAELNQIEMDEHTDMCGIDGYLMLEYGYTEDPRRKEIIDRVMPRLAEFFKFTTWRHDRAEFFRIVESKRNRS